LIVQYEKNQWEYGNDKQDDNCGDIHFGTLLKGATFLSIPPMKSAIIDLAQSPAFYL